MARKREIARIERARKNLKNSQARFNRATKIDFRALETAAQKERASNGRKPRAQRTYKATGKLRDAHSRLAKSGAQIKEFRGKLATALKAPVRDQQRDISRRPTRYHDVKKARTTNQRAERKADNEIKAIRDARMTGREGMAQRLVQDAVNRGENPDDVFKAIAKRTGMSEVGVYTLFMYASPDNPNPV